MLQILVTDEFARWFAALRNDDAEDVATLLDLTAELGPSKAPPESRESLLWYEHTSVANTGSRGSLAFALEEWGGFRDYVRKVLAQLESPRFTGRLTSLPSKEASIVIEAVRGLKRAIDPRRRWALRLIHEDRAAFDAQAVDAREEARKLYLTALEAAGFSAIDVSPHSLALREVSRRSTTPAFRLLYGVNVERETALFVLGEWLDRSFYGDSVRRAETLWKQFLNGSLPTSETSTQLMKNR